MNKFSEVFSNQVKYITINDKNALSESDKGNSNQIITMNRDENDFNQNQKMQNKQKNKPALAILTLGLIILSLVHIMILYGNKIRSGEELSFAVYAYIITALADFAIFFTLSICRLHGRFIEDYSGYIVYTLVYRILVLLIDVYTIYKVIIGDILL